MSSPGGRRSTGSRGFMKTKSPANATNAPAKAGKAGGKATAKAPDGNLSLLINDTGFKFMFRCQMAQMVFS
jgi:hypothetical protein